MKYINKGIKKHKAGNSQFDNKYIADFVCLEKKIIIEIDGGYHFTDNQIVKDEDRTDILESFGFKVIRFTNEEVLFNTNNVILEIKRTINK